MHEWTFPFAHSSQIAAAYGHVELCRFLLNNTSLFNDSSTLRSAFMAFLKPHMSFRLGSSTLELQQNLSLVVEALYHLFAREHGMDEYAVYSLADYVGHDVDRDSGNNL